MADLNEETLINQIADIERDIVGVENSFNFAQNPDSLTNAQLPAVLHYETEFISSPFGHHNVWRNEFVVRSILLVTPRQGSGGRLKYVENAAIPFLKKWRVAFQTAANVRLILNTGVTNAYEFTGQYGAGGTLLIHNDIEYVGAVFTFTFKEHN